MSDISYNNLSDILTNIIGFLLDSLVYATIVVNVVTYDLTYRNYMEEHHTTIRHILSGRLSLMCILNSVGMPSLIYWAIFDVPL